MAAPTWSRALVTGASSGIGEAIARQLAAAGTDLVLVARREEALRTLADELAQHHDVAVEVLAADLADPAERAVVEERAASTADPVDLLVNNAGFGSFGDFHRLDIDREQHEIGVNVLALVRLTHAALQQMVPRGKGSVMNVSSLASLQALPRNATYSASKAFVTNFSEALHEELRGSGVIVTAVLPGMTRTEFSGMTDVETRLIPGFAWMNADEVAKQALGDTARGDALCVPGLVNQVVATVTAPVPRFIKRWVTGTVARRL
ncbi:MAG: SDR family NAD(P)-dependent oxidoreductase [Acidimicrobiales bacterium]